MSDEARRYISGDDGDNQPQYTEEQMQGLSATERKEIEAQVNKAKAMMDAAMNKVSLQRAETKLNAMCDAYKQQTGMSNVPPFKVEEFKRELRNQGIEIW